MIILFTATGSKKTKEKETKSIPTTTPRAPAKSNTVTLLDSSSALTKRKEKGFSCNRTDGQTDRGDRQLPLPKA